MATYVLADDAPFSVPPSVLVHDTITVANAAVTLGTATGSAGVPTYQDGQNDKKYPKAVYLCHLDTAADVWVTWDGQTPAVGTTSAALGVKVPPTYPALRIPIPAAIKNDTIKIISGAAGGTPVVVVWEF